MGVLFDADALDAAAGAAKVTKPLGKKALAALAKAHPHATTEIAVRNLRDLADKIEKNPEEFESFEYGLDPYSQEPRFETLTVRRRLNLKRKPAKRPKKGAAKIP